MSYTGTDLIENIQDMLINHEPEVLEEVYNNLASETVEHVGDDKFEVTADHIPWEEKTTTQKIDHAVSNIGQMLDKAHEIAPDDLHDGVWEELGEIEWTLDYQLKPAVEELKPDVLEEPLSDEELQEILETTEDGRVEEIVEVHMSSFEETDLEGLLDHLSRQVIGSPLLLEISYEVIGVASPTSIYLEVSGFIPSDYYTE